MLRFVSNDPEKITAFFTLIPPLTACILPHSGQGFAACFSCNGRFAWKPLAKDHPTILFSNFFCSLLVNKLER